MWENANGKAFNTQVSKFSYTEMSLTANMPLKEMLDRKIKWKTLDDDEMTESKKLDYSIVNGSITLEPQRIRVFKVEYSKVSLESIKIIQ